MTKDEIFEEIRMRVFLAPTTEDPVLLGTALAEEFKISRTPIRQMLEWLESERLVVTKPGVGTIIPALDEATRGIDAAAQIELTHAASRLAAGPVPTNLKVRVAGMMQVLDSLKEADLHFYVSHSIGYIQDLASTIQSPILADAFLTSRWRQMRWRIRDAEQDIQTFWASVLTNLVDFNEVVTNGTLADAFEHSAIRAEEMVRQSQAADQPSPAQRVVPIR